MKPSLPLLAVVLVAGTALGWVGMKAALAERTPYEPVTLEDRPETVPVRLSGEVPAGCVVQELDVEGMCCAGCPSKLYSVLAGVPGVEEIAVDPILGRASVVVRDDVDVVSLEGALTFGAYSATAREAP